MGIPNFEYILKKRDFQSSNLKYNLGYFEYDEKRDRYFENKSYRQELFNLAPNRNIEGLFEATSHKSNSNPSSPIINNSEMDILGKPYIRTKKEKFMYNLNHSLKLAKDKTDQYYKELKVLNLFKQSLNKSKKYNFGDSDNLMINQLLDLNYVQIAEFSHLKERSKSKLFYKLVKLADYTRNSREFLLNASGLVRDKIDSENKESRANESSKVEDSIVPNMNSTRTIS